MLNNLQGSSSFKQLSAQGKTETSTSEASKSQDAFESIYEYANTSENQEGGPQPQNPEDPDHQQTATAGKDGETRQLAAESGGLTEPEHSRIAFISDSHSSSDDLTGGGDPSGHAEVFAGLADDAHAPKSGSDEFDAENTVAIRGDAHTQTGISQKSQAATFVVPPETKDGPGEIPGQNAQPSRSGMDPDLPAEEQAAAKNANIVGMAVQQTLFRQNRAAPEVWRTTPDPQPVAKAQPNVEFSGATADDVALGVRDGPVAEIQARLDRHAKPDPGKPAGSVQFAAGATIPDPSKSEQTMVTTNVIAQKDTLDLLLDGEAETIEAELGLAAGTANSVSGSSPTSVFNRADLPKSIASQLQDVARSMGGRPVEVTLNPEELGRVRMSVSTSENGVTLNIIAERPETLELMKRNAGMLSREFASLGFETLDLSFGQGSSSEAGNDDGTGEDQKQQAGEQLVGISGAKAGEDPEIPSATLNIGNSDGVDIRI